MLLSCADLFAGAGGFSLAARQAGLSVRLAIENNKHAADTYRARFCGGNEPAVLLDGDITNLTPSKVFEETFGSDGRCDLILGGPPCQGFSTHRINGAGIEDKRNELIHTYFEFVEAFSPTAFLMENVPGMLWPRHARYMEEFRASADRAGYFVYPAETLDARDFGVPQRRKRIFVLGVKKSVDRREFSWPPKQTHGNDKAREADPALKSWENCKSVFRKAPAGDPNNVHMKHSDKLIEAFKKTPKNGGSRHQSGRILECHKNHDGHKDVYGRIDPSKPGPTMTTACINPSKGRFVHPEQHHGITVRQAARMQTFPDNFVFQGGLIAAGQQVGNAVPVALGYALIKHLVPLLNSAAPQPASRKKKSPQKPKTNSRALEQA